MNLEARERRMLWVLVGMLVLAGWFYGRPWLLGWLRESMAGTSGRQTGITISLPSEPLVELRLASLAAQPAEYTPGRNIFDYGKAPRPEPPPTRKAPPPPKPLVVETRPQTETAPKPPPVEFTLMGVFGPDHRRVAVLNDEKSIINVLQSDVIDESFVIVDINYLWIDVGFVDFPDASPVRLDIER